MENYPEKDAMSEIEICWSDIEKLRNFRTRNLFDDKTSIAGKEKAGDELAENLLKSASGEIEDMLKMPPQINTKEALENAIKKLHILLVIHTETLFEKSPDKFMKFLPKFQQIMGGLKEQYDDIV